MAHPVIHNDERRRDPRLSLGKFHPAKVKVPAPKARHAGDDHANTDCPVCAAAAKAA